MTNKLPINKDYLISSLKEFDKKILDKKYSKIYNNESTLDKLSESTDGTLLFDGNSIQSAENGKSAYDIAIDNGFNGSQEEWLNSLKGEQGETGKTGRSIKSITTENNNVIVTYTDDKTEVIGQLNVDVQANFLTSNGFGNLRYYNNNFQYYNTETLNWHDISMDSKNIYILNMIPKEMQKFGGFYDPESKHYKLKWTEPSDTIIDNQAACIVEKVIIRRKLGEQPLNMSDGILVKEIKRLDFFNHEKNYFEDKSFNPQLGDIWYYKAFPISTTGFANESDYNSVNILCKDYTVYGFQLDLNESDPNSMITYIEDNKYFSSAFMDYNSGNFDYGDWENSWFIKNLKPCMLKYNGDVDYELNKNDFSKKIDGSDSDISNETYEGNAMIGFPKIYYKIINEDKNLTNVYFSNIKVDENYKCYSHIDINGNEIDYCYMPIYNGSLSSNVLRSLSNKAPIYSKSLTSELEAAIANNQNSDNIWYTETLSDRLLVNLLLMLIGKSTDSQSTFGNGYYTGGSQSSNPAIMTGTMDQKGMFWGNNGSSMLGVKVFGIENLWGNQWRRIAGWINDNGTQKIKLTSGQYDGSTIDDYNTTGEGYITIPNSTVNKTAGGYISKMLFNKFGMFPISVGGSATTFFTDGIWCNNTDINYALVGGVSNHGLVVGMFATSLNDSSSMVRWNIGSSISCKPLLKDNNGGN